MYIAYRLTHSPRHTAINNNPTETCLCEPLVGPIWSQENAFRPVSARPRASVWISCVPSYVYTLSMFIRCRMMGYASVIPVQTNTWFEIHIVPMSLWKARVNRAWHTKCAMQALHFVVLGAHTIKCNDYKFNACNVVLSYVFRLCV
jgi:hypothetical protein